MEPLSESYSLDRIARKRRNLIPFWIKTFSMIFVIAAALVLLAFIWNLFGGQKKLQIYGLTSENPFSVISITVCALFLLKGVVGCGLLEDKGWALNLGIFDALVGIAICAGSVIAEAIEGNIDPRIELFFLAPYLVKLYDIKKKW